MGEPIRKERKLGAAPKVNLRNVDGSTVREISLDPTFFALEPNVPVMHQVVNAQLAAARAGTQSTKTRAEVSGGGAKPFRQKGTGRARAGSTRSPIWSGGGVALGPKPRSYEQKTPKKMVQLALRSALSDRASEGKVVVVDTFGYEAPKTKDALAFLKANEIDGSVLVVLGDEDEKVFLSFRNLPRIHVVHETELNTFDVLRHDYIVFTQETLPTSVESTPVATPTRKAAPSTAEVATEASTEEGAAE
jgi:large subunit ribosomal protein L4